MPDEISLDDRVLSVLSTEPQTEKEVYESLSLVVTENTEKDEIITVLERLSNLGVINEITVSGTKKYTSESGEMSGNSKNQGVNL